MYACEQDRFTGGETCRKGRHHDVDWEGDGAKDQGRSEGSRLYDEGKNGGNNGLL